MRPCTTALKSFLDNWGTATQASIADLYIFTLITGEVFYYSGFQTSVSAPLANTTGPNVLFQLGPRFARTKMKVETGPQVDELMIDIYASSDDILAMNAGGNITWQDAFFVGLFDGAYCELLRAFLTGNPPQVVGTITWFYGRVGDIDVGRTRSSMRVKSLLDLLTVQMPRRLFQSSCNLTFGEPGYGMCGYDRVNGISADGNGGPGAFAGVAFDGSTQETIVVAGGPGNPGAYNNGTILCTQGLNNGYARTIGVFGTNTDTGLSQAFFLKPFIFPVSIGNDVFQFLPGCDHTLDTCTNVFNNRSRYGGFPFIPPPETAI